MPAEAELDEAGEVEVAPSPFVDGASAAAILLLLLEESEAAAILAHFDPDEVRVLGKAMFGAATASEEQITLALHRFVSEGRALSALSIRAEPRIRRMMHEALGNVRADNILSAIAPQSSANALDIIRWMQVPVIARVLANEHPQVGAIILAVLTPEVAAEAIEGLDENVQADLVCRAARLSQVSAEAIEDLEKILEKATSGRGSKPAVKVGGKSEVARIVNSMKKQTGEKVMRSVKKRDKQLGFELEEELFVFENLLELDNKSLGTLMRSVDAATLSLALKGASELLVSKILGSMSARAAQSIRDDMAERGPVKRAEVDDAQREIIATARNLAEDGSIMLGGKGDDYV